MRGLWRIEAYDGLNKIEEVTAPAGCNIKDLLLRLICQRLTTAQIVNSCRRSNDKFASDPFNIKRDAAGSWTAGDSGIHFAARKIPGGRQ